MPLIDPLYSPYSDLRQLLVGFDSDVPTSVYEVGANALKTNNLRIKVAPDLYSVRWTRKFDRVPDAGSTLGLLALTLGGLGFLRRSK